MDQSPSARPKLRLCHILEELRGLLPVVQLPAPWDYLTCDPDCRQFPADRKPVLKRLAKKFGADVLVKAGIATDDRGELGLCPRLDTDDGIIVFVRGVTKFWMDAVSSRGSLKFDIPLFALAEDIRLELEPGSPRHYCYLTTSMADVALIRSVGLIAAPITGLLSMEAHELGHLLYLLAGTSRGNIRPQRLPAAQALRFTPYCSDEPEGMAHPVILGHALLADEPSDVDQIDTVVRHLAQASQLLKLDWQEFDIWEPTPQDLENFRYRRNLRSRELLGEFLLRLKLRSVTKYSHGYPRARSVGTSPLQRALRKVERAQRLHSAGDFLAEKKLKAAWARFQRTLDRAVFLPSVAASMSSPSAVRELSLFRALLSRDLFLRMNERNFNEAGNPSGPRLLDEDVQKSLEMIIKLAEQERRCQTKD